MIYYRDPLLEKICDRILDLSMPAFIKNSELIFVAVNDAFANLFNLTPTDLVGTTGESAELEALLDIEDKERACLVFGEDQRTSFVDPFGKGRFRVEMERFTLADGQTFLYCIFGEMRTTDGPGPGLPREAARFIERPEGEKGTINGQQIEHLVDVMDVGLCIFDAEDRLTYANDKVRELYRGVIDDIRIGMTLRNTAEQSLASYMHADPEQFGDMDEEARRAWIEERIAPYHQASSSFYQKLRTGIWINNVNRRLPDGSMVGLRIDVSEMKERERLLERHVEEIGLYRELLNRLPVAAFARDADHKLAFVNQAYSDLFGRPIDELLGMDEKGLFGDHIADAWNCNDDTLSHGTEYEREQETRVAGGRIATTLVNTGRLVTGQGTSFVVGTLVDISAIRQRERLLQEANAKAEAIRQDFENIVSGIDVGVIVLDEDLRIQLVNEAYRMKIWGASAELWSGELVGRPFEDLLRNNYNAGRTPEGADDIDGYCRGRLEEIRSGSIKAREVTFTDGTVTLYSGIQLSGGKFLLSYVDVTAMRQRDREVAEAQQLVDRAYRLVRNATDTMPEGLMVIERDHIVFANPSLATVLNIPPELLVPGGRWEDVFRATSLQNPQNDEGTIGDGVKRFREAMAMRKDVSYNFPLDDERWVHLDMRSRGEGQSVILCSDQTTTMRREAELKRLIARAEAADRAKSEFLANMSLEIRTPMNGILGMAELLSKSELDTRQKAFLEIIMKSGHALLTIINDILDFSKLDAGHMQLRYAPFDPAEALEDVASLYAPKASDKDIELLVKRAGNVPDMIMGDAGRFRQILTNLIGNAVKFTEQGFVSASIGASADHAGQTILTVVVEDTGVGIPAEKLKSIFEKFSQMEMSTNRREGSGLGLAIAQRLAAIQGGIISVHSSEGKGSVFTFTIPVQVAAEHSRPRSLPANVEGARILFVDDHTIAREYLISHAGEWGFECVGAADAATAVSILDEAVANGVQVDAVVIDCQMPHMSGAEMAHRIRHDQRFDGLAVILMTAQDIAACEKMVGGVRIEAYLAKPIRINVLRNTLVDVIRTTRARTMAPKQTVVSLPLPVASDVLERELPLPMEMPTLPVGKAAAADRPYVLVAEDNEINQIFFSQILDAAGIPYQLVNNGEAAVSAWQRATPAIILMDTRMPVLDGLEATRMIRAIEAMTGQHTPIVGVVSHSQEGDAAQCVEAGMDDHIAKPVTPERLEQKIHQWSPHDFRAPGAALYLA